MVEELKRQNNLTGFIDKISKRHGFPNWNLTKSVTSKMRNNKNMRSADNLSGIDTIIYIPLVSEDNPSNIKSFIEAKISDSIDLSLFIANDYEKLLNFEQQDSTLKGMASDYAFFIMKMQHDLYGTNSFKITDSNLMVVENYSNNNTKRVSKIKFDNTSNQSLQRLYVFFDNDETGCRELWSADDNGSNPVLVDCNCGSGWGHGCGSGGGGGTGGGGDGGSGGGGGWGLGWDWGDDGGVWNGDGGYGGGVGGGGNGGSSGCRSIGYKIIDGKLYNPCGGGGTDGDGGWVPEDDETSSLLLSHSQKDWLVAHNNRSVEINRYLKQSTLPENDKLRIALDHIIKMMGDPDYLTFVDNYAINNPNSTDMWWENNSWLSDADNFNLDIEGGIVGQFKSLTPAEKALTLSYPLAAYIINKHKDNSWQMAYTKYPGPSNTPDHLGINDRKNAFLHAYWSAICSRDVGSALATMFTNAHEAGTPQVLALEKQMDLFNNNVGIVYGETCTPLLTPDSDVANQIMIKLQNGELRFLAPLDWVNSPLYNPNCSTCLDGITSQTLMIPTN